MTTKRRRAPARVGLVLLGAVSISACEQAPLQRHVYKSLRECTQDWGTGQCEPAVDRHPAGYYLGPAFCSSAANAVAGLHAIETEQAVARGGFGGAAFGCGG